MPIGHSILDYIVVVLVALWTLRLLSVGPQRLLLWLPLFLTIDFFIPFGTQLTPSRFVPFLLAGWLLHKGVLTPPPRYIGVISAAVIVLTGYFAFSLLVDDSGARPFFRLLHYSSLIFVFIFVLRASSESSFLEYAIWGLFLAGIVHGIYCYYQVFADVVGLPYRGVIYNASGQTVSIQTNATIRVNGFADEPKRLGYILMTAAIIAGYFLLRLDRRRMQLPLGRWSKMFRKPPILLAAAASLVLASLLTYSGSLFLSVAGVLAWLTLTLSTRAILVSAVASFGLFTAAFIAPSALESYADAASEILGDRVQELEAGLDANKVYRQELFAQAFVNDHPPALITGVGLGRYNRVLHERFGPGAGYGFNGAIMPLNSQVFEIGFDLGIAGLIIFYAGGLALLLRVGRKGTFDFTLSTILTFLLVQSTFIENKFYVAFVAATAAAWLRQRSAKSRGPNTRAPAARPNFRKRMIRQV